MGWIEFESFGFDCPDFADVFVGGEPFEGLESATEVIGVDEVVEVGVELSMARRPPAASSLVTGGAFGWSADSISFADRDQWSGNRSSYKRKFDYCLFER